MAFFMKVSPDEIEVTPQKKLIACLLFLLSSTKQAIIH